jgi:hypothetical protein
MCFGRGRPDRSMFLNLQRQNRLGTLRLLQSSRKGIATVVVELRQRPTRGSVCFLKSL